MNPLGFLLGLSPRAYLALGVVLVAGAAWIGHRIDVARHEKRAFAAGQAEVTARWDAAEKARAEAAAKAEAAARAEEQRRQAAQQEIDRAAHAALSQARADADAARGDADRVRQFAATLARAVGRGTAGDPAVAQPGAPAGDPGVLLSDMLGRCVARVQELAEFADASRAAGNACASSYESLTP